MAVLEVCVDSVESALAAQAGGAERVELCSALAEGGLTPSLGLIREVRRQLTIGVHVMIRPRAGDFLYSDEELAVMREDIGLARDAGADGVVFGVLDVEGDVDEVRTRELVGLAKAEASRPMEITFHRAIDMARELDAALEAVIRSGADRVLTSGAEENAVLGRERIGAMVRSADGRIKVMAGAGLRVENVKEVARVSGVTEFHASLRQTVRSAVTHQARSVHMGDAGVDEYARSVVRVEGVRAMREAIETAMRVSVR